MSITWTFIASYFLIYLFRFTWLWLPPWIVLTPNVVDAHRTITEFHKDVCRGSEEVLVIDPPTHTCKYEQKQMFAFVFCWWVIETVYSDIIAADLWPYTCTHL